MVPLPIYGYFVDETGTVWSIKRGAPRVVAPYIRTGGRTHYLRVRLYDNDVELHFYVHHLVAVAFIGPRPPGLIIRHLDGDSFNNSAANLAYGTQTENVADTRRHAIEAAGADDTDVVYVPDPELGF